MLADCIEIKERFAGGILYILLRNGAKIADIIQGLTEIAYQTGGKQFSREIKALKKAQVAFNMAFPWFHPRICLFLVDKLWRVNGTDKTIN